MNEESLHEHQEHAVEHPDPEHNAVGVSPGDLHDGGQSPLAGCIKELGKCRGTQ